MPDNLSTVCVYCAISVHVDQYYYEEAAKLGRLLAEEKITTVYGGSSKGMMGALADSALNSGGEVIGIMPRNVKNFELDHKNLTETLFVESMHERKMKMVERSGAFIVMPGGFGTLDETFEVLTWKQIGLHDKPIIIVNINGYWDKLLDLIDHTIQNRFALSENREMFKVVENAEDVIPSLKKEPNTFFSPKTKWM